MSDASGLSDTNNPENSDQDDTKDKEIDDPDHVEERFRVDRRRLEEMIQSPGSEGEDGTADDFFHRVMEATNTRITWPSKLKIGAKSKKDPHIKVCGHRDNVATAKDKIMAVLDMKSSRVTLKMDVSHTEHSHVIGKGGNNIKRVMQETGCHIHFPDSNRNLQAEKSNQVSIAGQPKGVEQAQAKIRELLPLVFMFELPLAGLLQPMVDATSPQIQQIQNTYGVTISFKQRTRVYASTTVIVRGSVCNAKSVKEATVVLIEHLTGSVGNAMPVSMQLEIAPQHHHFIIGRSGANIKQIMQQTGATIHFPDPSTTPAQRKGTVYITGAVESVLLARHQLIGCLPLVLMFDMKEDIPIEQPRISQLMEQLDVYISIKPKPKQPSKSVIVKSIERNTQNLYAARKWLLGLIDDNELLTTHNNNVDRTKTFCSAVYRPVMLLASPQAAFPLAPAAAAAAYAVYPPNGLIIKDAKLLKKDLKTPNEPVLKPMDAKVSISSSGVNTGTAPLVLSPAKQLPPSVDFKPVATNQQPPFSPKRHEVRVPVAEVRKAPTPIQDCQSLESHDSISVSVSSPLDLLTSAMSSSLLSDAQALGAITGNLPFSKSDLQDAVSSIQSKPDILERLLPTQPRPEKTRGILPNNTQPGKISSDTGSQGIAGDLFGRKLNSDFGPLPPQGFGTGTVLNSSQSSMAPPRRVKTPPGFSGHHKESSPLRELFDSQFQANIGAAAQQQRTNPKPPSPLGLPSPMNNIRYGQDSPLGCLGSPLGSGGSPLQGGSPLMTPVSPSMYMGRRLYQNGDTARSSESGDSDGSDCRAPGSNRPTRLTSPPPPLFSPTMTMFESFDYEQKKLLATKAMQKKPEGESRIPTDFWSGLGFSKSMPDSAIRERLKSSNVQRYNGPTMTTTYENAGDEIDGDPWRDTISEETEPDGVSPSSSTNHLVNHEDPNREEHSLLANNRHDEYISTAQDWPPKTDLAELFSKLGLGKYTDLFTQQEIDLVTFTTLTDLDLKELGISTFGARRKMLIAIADLNKRGTLPIAATTSSKLANSTTTTTHHYGGTDHSNHGNPFRDGGSHLMHSSSRRQDIASQSGRW